MADTDVKKLQAKNDRLHGEVKEYDEKGRLLKTRRYVDGVEQ